MSGGSRADRLARVLAVQEQKRKLEEWRLAEAVREEQRLQENERELLETLGNQSLMHGLFLDAKVSALRRNDEALGKTREHQGVVREALKLAATAEKRLERASAKARAAERNARERSDLLLALDDHLAARASDDR
ncbi:hypothetical protein [Aureimonas sp. AU12]|uniref:hypothetical protein n=1 Tax=Aureimonas sp. AU12 TaxID=1638161 RepID=UPI0007854D0C|nr:hypothetical protein [Aureimonas sp. AU12]